MTARRVAMQAGATFALLFGAIALMVTLNVVWTVAVTTIAFAIGAMTFGLAARTRDEG